MNGLAHQEGSVVLAAIRGQEYSKDFSDHEIDAALATVGEIFAGFEKVFAPSLPHVVIRHGGGQRPAEFARELVPAILHAHRHFGSGLPTGLKAKLANPTQTHNTIFELLCLGILRRHHRVVYEPVLSSGKTPDLMIRGLSGGPVYVECKSQNLRGGKWHRQFEAATSRIFGLIGESELAKQAWSAGLRTEVCLTRAPSETDFEDLHNCLLAQHTGDSSVVLVNDSVRLKLVDRYQPYDPARPSPAQIQTVATKPTALENRNVHAAVYPWPTLASVRRRAQRRLLSSARQKLRSIPEGSYGMVCMQTLFTRQFLPDVRHLVGEAQFARIPIVWLNPDGDSRIIYRQDQAALRDEIFSPLIKRARRRMRR